MDEKEKTIHTIRAFTRFYMPMLDLLGNHYLGSKYSATEARVLFEIYENDGCNAAYIANAMNIDKSYLSRIIKNYEKKGYLIRTVSKTDSRSLDLHLTELGLEQTKEFIRRSDAQIGEMIQSLDSEACRRLTHALDTVTELLKDGRKSKKFYWSECL